MLYFDLRWSRVLGRKRVSEGGGDILLYSILDSTSPELGIITVDAFADMVATIEASVGTGITGIC